MKSYFFLAVGIILLIAGSILNLFEKKIDLNKNIIKNTNIPVVSTNKAIDIEKILSTNSAITNSSIEEEKKELKKMEEIKEIITKTNKEEIKTENIKEEKLEVKNIDKEISKEKEEIKEIIANINEEEKKLKNIEEKKSEEKKIDKEISKEKLEKNYVLQFRSSREIETILEYKEKIEKILPIKIIRIDTYYRLISKNSYLDPEEANKDAKRVKEEIKNINIYIKKSKAYKEAPEILALIIEKKQENKKD